MLIFKYFKLVLNTSEEFTRELSYTNGTLNRILPYASIANDEVLKSHKEMLNDVGGPCGTHLAKQI